MNLNPEQRIQTIQLKVKYDYLAPDNSEIRLLPRMKNGSLSHCVLPPNQISDAVKHRTVEEIWYVIEGKGEIWRKNDSEEKIVELVPETSITIPVGTKFQFRNTGTDSLKIIIATMPPWPEASEAIKVSNYWKK